MSGNRIITTFAQWLAAQDPLSGENTSTPRAMFVHRLKRILRARRIEAASRRKHWSNSNLVRPNCPYTAALCNLSNSHSAKAFLIASCRVSKLAEYAVARALSSISKGGVSPVLISVRTRCQSRRLSLLRATAEFP